MKCLYCGKEITLKSSNEEQENCWHKKCVKKFFLCDKLPVLDVSEKDFKKIAEENVKSGFTIPGVQKKLSLYLSKESTPRLTMVNYPTGYILKPQTEEYEKLPEAEYLVMQMAREIGIKTVPFALIKTNNDGGYAYITKRIDRVNIDNKMKLLAIEDFCQLEGRLTEDKYKGFYERCAKVIKKYSSMVKFDLTELFLRLVFSFVIGNSDMHLKNFSLIEKEDISGEYVLSSAYDLLPVNLILQEDKAQLALTLNKKKCQIRKKDFLVFADEIGIERVSALKMINEIIRKKDILINICDESYLSKDMILKLKELITIRINILSE